MLKNLHIETVREHCVKKEVGAEVLKIDIIYLIFSLNEEKTDKVVEINRFYEDIAKNGKIYAEGELFEKIRTEYETDDDPKKRFRFKKYTYRVECYVSELSDGYLSVCIDSSLIRNGRCERFRRMSQTWDSSLKHLIPQRIKKGNLVTKSDGYYIKEGKCVIYSHDGGYHEEIISKMP